MTRHPSVEAVTRFFEYEHLPDSLREVAYTFWSVKNEMLSILDDDPELTAGLRKLLEAKDCFVRAKVAEINRSKGESHEGKPV